MPKIERKIPFGLVSATPLILASTCLLSTFHVHFSDGVSYGLCLTVQRSVAQVLWPNGQRNVYRLGHAGKVCNSLVM